MSDTTPPAGDATPEGGAPAPPPPPGAATPPPPPAAPTPPAAAPTPPDLGINVVGEIRNAKTDVLLSTSNDYVSVTTYVIKRENTAKVAALPSMRCCLVKPSCNIVQPLSSLCYWPR